MFYDINWENGRYDRTSDTFEVLKKIDEIAGLLLKKKTKKSTNMHKNLQREISYTKLCDIMTLCKKNGKISQNKQQ